MTLESRLASEALLGLTLVTMLGGQYRFYGYDVRLALVPALLLAFLACLTGVRSTLGCRRYFNIFKACMFSGSYYDAQLGWIFFGTGTEAGLNEQNAIRVRHSNLMFRDEARRPTEPLDLGTRREFPQNQAPNA